MNFWPGHSRTASRSPARAHAHPTLSMYANADALVIGAGPAGTSTAILLANAGWRVVLVEQHSYPRRKVCGECIAAGSLAVLDELGVGGAFRRMAGPELRQVGWMSAAATVVADPAALHGRPLPLRSSPWPRS